MAARIILTFIIFSCVAVLLTLHFTIDKESLSQQETDRISLSCGNCHNNPHHLDDTNVHRKHFGANCISCHVNDGDLEEASDARNIFAWIGTGITGLVVVVIVINYIIVRRRQEFSGSRS